MIDVIPYNSKIKLAPSVLILGAFDALHNGHLMLINEAKKFNLPVVMTLFDDTTKIPSKKATWQYATLNIKLEQLCNLGVSKVILIDFEQVKNLSGGDFIASIVNLTNAQHIIVGYNFGYGKNRAQNCHNLSQQFKNTIVVPEYKFKSQSVSTSLLKQLVVLGEVDVIKDLAPFPYTVIATITKAGNVKMSNHSWLHPGIYSVFVEIAHTRYYGLYHHGLKKQAIIIPDFSFEKVEYEAKIMIICHVRHIINQRDDIVTSNDLLISKNKLTSYVKNHI